MNQNQTLKNPIIEGVIWKEMLLFFFPIVLGTFFQQLYNTADTVVVGRFVGKEALAAVGGSASMIVTLVVGFFVGLASGATVLISQYFGAKDTTQLNRALHTAYAFSIVGSIVLSVAGYLISPWLLQLMNTPENIIADSILYLRIYFLGILFVFIYNIGSSILRAVGDSKRPLYFLIVCCVLNIVLDIVLVLFFHMGVSGVALATVISQAVSAVLITGTLMNSEDIYRLDIKEIRFYKNALISLILIGLPSGLQTVMYNGSNILVQSCLNKLGTDTIAAWTTFGKIDGIYWMINNAFSIAVTTFVGQNYGAGKYDRMKKSVNIGIAMALITAFSITGIFFLSGEFLFGIFTEDISVIAIGMQMLRMIAPAYFLFVFIELLSGALRGVGDVLLPTIMTCFGVCVLRILWMLFVVPMKPELDTITMNYPITWAITAIMFIVYYLIKFKKFSRSK